MDRKHKGLIIFSTVYAVLLILFSIGLLYYVFVFQPNEYAIEGPIDIEIEDIGNGEYKIENQIFKRVKISNIDDNSLLNYSYEELMIAVNTYKPQNDNFYKDNIYMIEKQIYIMDDDTDREYLLFFIDSDYFYINIDIFKGKIVTITKDELTDGTFVFLKALEYYESIDESGFFDFFEDITMLDSSILEIILPVVWIGKPVIYLYPQEETDVMVNLFGATFTTTYPKYNNGWFVTAYPDGTLVDKNGREYNYLYWEGMSKTFIDVSEGFVIEKENYIEFLETTLLEIGMIDTEINDFITYWLPQMNEYDYCFLSFQMENYEKEIQLKYSVEPDNELRVYVVFCGLDKYMDVQSQDLSYYSNFMREGFTVVEWGGTFLDNTDALYYQQNYIEKGSTVIVDDSESGIIDNEIDYSIVDTSIKNKEWWVYFQDKNIKTKEVLLEELKDLEIELDNFKIFNLQDNKIFVTKYDKTSLFMIIEEYGIYLNLEAFKELKAQEQVQFFRCFFDWFEESSFDGDTVINCMDSLQDIDVSVSTALLPILYTPTPTLHYDYYYDIEYLLAYFLPILFCYLVMMVSHKIVSKSIISEEDIKNYFSPYFYKESKNIINIFKVMVLSLIVILFLFLLSEFISVPIIDVIGVIFVIISLIVYSFSFVVFTVKSLSVTFLNDICRYEKEGKKNSRIILLFYILWVLPLYLLLIAISLSMI